MGREERRVRDFNYGARTRKVHLSRVHPDGAVDCVCERSAWFFKKAKAVGCRCRSNRRGNPKLAVGRTYGGFQWQPGAVERIAGKRLTRAWTLWVREFDADDFDRDISLR